MSRVRKNLTESNLLLNRLIIDLLLKENLVFSNTRILIYEPIRTYLLGQDCKPGTCQCLWHESAWLPGECLSYVTKYKVETGCDQNGPFHVNDVAVYHQRSHSLTWVTEHPNALEIPHNFLFGSCLMMCIIELIKKFGYWQRSLIHLSLICRQNILYLSLQCTKVKTIICRLEANLKQKMVKYFFLLKIGLARTKS